MDEDEPLRSLQVILIVCFAECLLSYTSSLLPIYCHALQDELPNYWSRTHLTGVRGYTAATVAGNILLIWCPESLTLGPAQQFQIQSGKRVPSGVSRLLTNVQATPYHTKGDHIPNMANTIVITMLHADQYLVRFAYLTVQLQTAGYSTF